MNSNVQHALASYEKLLPLKKPSNLAERTVATEIYAISAGNLGDVIRLLIDCSKAAINGEKECIDIEIINQFKKQKDTSSYRSIRTLTL